MKQDTLIFPIEYKSKSDIIKIKPLMDLHYGSRTCDLKEFKDYIRDFDDLTYFFTNGDLWDSIYFTDKRFTPSGHDHTDLDDAIDKEVNDMVKLLEPIKDRIICVGHGNHEQTIVKRCHTNPSKRLAELLNIPYMGYAYWFRLALSCNGGQGRSIDFFVSHGFGGGTRTEGGSITKYAKFADRFLCDVCVVGHDHRKQYVRYPVLGIQGRERVRLFAKSKLIVIGGSWKKTFSIGTDTTWEQSMGFPPSELGGVVIEIKPDDNWVKLNVSM